MRGFAEVSIGQSAVSGHVPMRWYGWVMTDTNTPADTESPPGPLAGVKVLDLTRVLAGPFGTMLLADLGADVIKVERPGRGDDTRTFGPPFVGGESTYFMSINRGKRSVAVDIKTDHGREVLGRLIDQCDVIVENFRPGVLERLGFGWDAVHARNPRAVYASVSGFGHAGIAEHVQSPGYDLMIQAMSGVASLTGRPDSDPTKAGISVGDLVAGLYAVHGILAALYEREKTGVGRRVDIAMLDGLVSLLTYQAGSYLMADKIPFRMGNQHPSICPFETVVCSDGHLVICCGNDAQFDRLAPAFGRPDWTSDERFSTNSARVQNRPALIEQIEAVTKSDSVAALRTRLAAADVPCAPILSVDEALTHPQLLARSMVGEVNHPTAGTLRTLGCPIRIGDEASFNSRPAPTLGQHTDEILAELGF
ncbi:MAG: crotonobetainyl-CoA:carnitine CoA-transferase CaiB-like acyl-CoA transferase [Myxococcota bacterium]|jgi:crotonobetainyl-CoA:carnitine CoA-transferase CaiB-like acyl-CoA transferase